MDTDSHGWEKGFTRIARLEMRFEPAHNECMKTVTLREAPARLEELFDDAQAGSPVLLVQNGQVAKLERIEPPEFGGDVRVLENMLLDAVRGPHADWTPQDLEDIARRVKERRGK
jgi:hypothetical protein